MKSILRLLFCLLLIVWGARASALTCADYFLGRKPSFISRLGTTLKDPETFDLSRIFSFDKGQLQFLYNPTEAIQQRWMALTGLRIPDEVLAKADLNWDPDFTHAPNLDAILMSSLYTRYDYTSQLIAKALEFHARRGTKIVYATSYSVVQLEEVKRKVSLGRLQMSTTVQKDMAFLNGLKEAGIEVETLQLRDARPQRFGTYGSFLKAMHAKAMILYSASNPAHNWVFMGGRNYSDSYFIKDCPDLSQCNYLLQYNTDYKWMYVTDFDISINDQQFAREVADTLATILPQRRRQSLRDHLYTRPNHVNEAARTIRENRRVSARTFVSLAGKDLQAMYVQAIDNATESIEIYTPYLNPPKDIAKAIQRAAERGVKVTITTNLRLAGDDFPAWAVKVIEAFNNAGGGKIAKWVRFRKWKLNDLFHPKVVVVDGQFMIVSSVNMNKRSFDKDTENGIVLEGQEAVQDFIQNVVNKEILPNSEPVSQLQNLPWYHRLIFKLFGSLF